MDLFLFLTFYKRGNFRESFIFGCKLDAMKEMVRFLWIKKENGKIWTRTIDFGMKTVNVVSTKYDIS